MKSKLYSQLERYCSFGPYPFHMPGHKRQLMPVDGLPYGWDVTEVPGTDDLHEAEGILREAMDRTASVWGAQQTWYLVNGSTCGLLAGIRALAPRGSRIVAARNCHKAVYHGVELGSLSVRWVMPELLPEGVCGPVDPEQLKTALEETPDAACVVLTSPTYEGILSDIRACADLCHARNIPLLVDEAHGAHLGLAPDWPESALHLGADVVVQSVHKTLPSLTQTALLHLGKGSLADPGEIERQLDVFETSSPSYPLLVSIDGCTELVLREGKTLLSRWRQRIEALEQRLEGLKHLALLGHGENRGWEMDPGKLPIFTGKTGIHGAQLGEILRKQYGIETEMCQGDICLAMTGMGDTDRAMDCLARALLEIDRGLSSVSRQAAVTLPKPGREMEKIGDAVLEAAVTCPWEQALGRTCGEYVWAYPPGIPLILPGEQISPEFLETVRALKASGTRLYQSRSTTEGIAVL